MAGNGSYAGSYGVGEAMVPRDNRGDQAADIGRDQPGNPEVSGRLNAARALSRAEGLQRRSERRWNGPQSYRR